MVKGQRCSTLFLEKASLFSTSTTLAPSRASSMAVRRPHGPAPMIRHCQQEKKRQILCKFVKATGAIRMEISVRI